VSGDPLGEIIAIAYTDHIRRMLVPSPLSKLLAEEAKQREASLSRAYKFRRAIRKRWDRSRFWLSNAIYKHDTPDY